jgi:hypothetical protein
LAFGGRDFLARKLAGGHRVEALDALRGFAVGDCLDLERVKFAELGDLIEAQRGVVDKPDGGRLWHEKLLCHEYNPPVRPRRGRGPWMKPPFPGNRRSYNRKPVAIAILAVGFRKPVQGLIAARICAVINGRHGNQVAFKMIW